MLYNEVIINTKFYIEERYVLSLDLKVVVDIHDLREEGSWFPIEGAWSENG